jgi:hypothetical protein
VIYCLASIALVGMHDYRTLDLHSGFAGAFRLAITVIYKKSKYVAARYLKSLSVNELRV